MSDTDLNDEIWKTYKQNYEISNLSRIRTITRVVKCGINGGKTTIIGRICTPTITKKGYYSINVNGKPELFHRILGKLFIPNPKHLPEINHKDGIKKNVELSNLEWITTQGNAIHAYDNHLNPSGENHCKAKLTNIQVIEIKERSKKEVISNSKLAKEYNVNQSTISRIINNKRRKRG